MKKRFLFVLILGMSFAPTALANTKTGEQRLSGTNMAGVRCGEEFRLKPVEATVAPRQTRPAATGSKAHAAL